MKKVVLWLMLTFAYLPIGFTQIEGDQQHWYEEIPEQEGEPEYIVIGNVWHTVVYFQDEA